jgi:hypothetical protein
VQKLSRRFNDLNELLTYVLLCSVTTTYKWCYDSVLTLSATKTLALLRASDSRPRAVFKPRACCVWYNDIEEQGMRYKGLV